MKKSFICGGVKEFEHHCFVTRRDRDGMSETRTLTFYIIREFFETPRAMERQCVRFTHARHGCGGRVGRPSA